MHVELNVVAAPIGAGDRLFPARREVRELPDLFALAQVVDLLHHFGVDRTAQAVGLVDLEQPRHRRELYFLHVAGAVASELPVIDKYQRDHQWPPWIRDCLCAAGVLA